MTETHRLDWSRPGVLTSVPDGERERLIVGVLLQQVRRRISRGTSGTRWAPLAGPVSQPEVEGTVVLLQVKGALP